MVEMAFGHFPPTAAVLNFRPGGVCCVGWKWPVGHLHHFGFAANPLNVRGWGKEFKIVLES